MRSLPDASGPEPGPHRHQVTRKVIVATAAPWCGEVYLSREGGSRRPFSSFAEFCSALRATTGWYDESSRLVDALAGAATSQRAPASKAQVGMKFIIAADTPWQGTAYRTRRGFQQRPFSSFAQLLGATLEITGWQITRDCAPDPRHQIQEMARARGTR